MGRCLVVMCVSLFAGFLTAVFLGVGSGDISRDSELALGAVYFQQGMAPRLEENPVDVQQLRQAVVDGCDEVLARPLLRMVLTDAQRNLIKAQRAYWTKASDEELRKLLVLVPAGSEKE